MQLILPVRVYYAFRFDCPPDGIAQALEYAEVPLNPEDKYSQYRFIQNEADVKVFLEYTLDMLLLTPSPLQYVFLTVSLDKRYDVIS
jgi:rRNA maturation protein Nop10